MCMHVDMKLYTWLHVTKSVKVMQIHMQYNRAGIARNNVCSTTPVIAVHTGRYVYGYPGTPREEKNSRIKLEVPYLYAVELTDNKKDSYICSGFQLNNYRVKFEYLNCILHQTHNLHCSKSLQYQRDQCSYYCNSARTELVKQ